MILSALKLFARLTRLDAVIAIYFGFFIPILVSSNNFSYTSLSGLPVAAICMCGFVINNLYDIEKDKENHPDRPLPSGQIPSTLASAIYFLLLAASLYLVRIYANEENIFYYLIFLVAMVNYNVAIYYFPFLKNLYVAVAGVIPVFILSTLVQAHRSSNYVACALFFYLLGKEMLTDILDSKGDGQTLIKIISPRTAAHFAFVLKLISDSFLLLESHKLVGAFLTIGFILSDAICFFLWNSYSLRKMVIGVMKIQAVLGIYYLV